MEVPVRDASTVVLLRDGSDGMEVWLQRRASTMVFAADMHAFPGGAVDAEDSSADLARVDVQRHAEAWGDADASRVGSLVAAAVRETREECGVEVAPETLVPWARWVTPVGSPRRFDARFFVARCPSDADPRPTAAEVAHAEWVVVAAAVERFAAGELAMWPPTIATLVELAAFSDVEAALAAAPLRIQAVTK
ncbi:MAG: NUDIX domain-containing protein [Actinomycetota bacterium]|nr:NUDIX domain-containing protein [Actinomycetota bacterium]MDH5277896.1 NUDIX domain-containing protein [Actinomycetota bacterium]